MQPARFWGMIRDPGRPLRQRVLLASALISGLLVVVLIVVTLAVGVYALTLIPDTPDAYLLSRATRAQPTVVYAASGEKLTQFEQPFREWVPLDSIPDAFIDALIATEDRRFYDHGGIDVRRTIGAAFRTLLGNRQGGSTITQQLARNLFPVEIGRERTLKRKLKEFIAAYTIERNHAKEEILEAYVNTVPFLYNAYGVEPAARTYFGTHAPNLSVPQSATLVAMLKGPDRYNPVRHPTRALTRRNLVLRQMETMGIISTTEYNQFRAEELGVELSPQPGVASLAPHFTEAVRKEVEAWAGPRGYDITRDGLVIHTTLSLDLQREAAQSLANEAEKLQAVADVEWSRAGMPSLGWNAENYVRARGRYAPFAYFWQRNGALLDAHLKRTAAFEALRDRGMGEGEALAELRNRSELVESVKEAVTRLEAGLVAIDPVTGAVRAYVGGRDFSVDQYDHAGVARRQPGSTFKAFVYAAAVQRGYLPSDTLQDRAPEFGEDHRDWRLSGAGTGDTLTLADALAYSKNAVTVRLVNEMGPARVAQVARQLGIQSELDVVPSIGLGTSAVTLLEMVAAYATIANDGRRREPRLIDRIETAEGRVLKQFENEGGQVMTRHDARLVIDMLRGVVDRGTGRSVRAYGVTGDVAGKTGTTQRSADGWFILMHPRLVTGAWVGFNDQRVAFRSTHWGYGASNALPIAASFLASVQDHLPVATFPDPPRMDYPPILGAHLDSLTQARVDSLLQSSETLRRKREDSLRAILEEEGPGDEDTYQAVELDSLPPAIVPGDQNPPQLDSLLERQETPHQGLQETVRDSAEGGVKVDW